MYAVGVRIASGETVKRYCENIDGLCDITDDGETLCVVHNTGDFPVTADMCNDARAARSHWRQVYSAGGSHYPE